MSENPFPLNISEKEDSWSRIQLLSSTGAQFKLPATEFNKLVKAAEFLYENIGGLPFTGTPPVRTFQTLDQLIAFGPVPEEGTPAKVANDPTASKNGFYAVNGGEWVKDSALFIGEVIEGDTEAVTGDKIYTALNSKSTKEAIDTVRLEISKRYLNNVSGYNDGNDFNFTAFSGSLSFISSLGDEPVEVNNYLRVSGLNAEIISKLYNDKYFGFWINENDIGTQFKIDYYNYDAANAIVGYVSKVFSSSDIFLGKEFLLDTYSFDTEVFVKFLTSDNGWIYVFIKGIADQAETTQYQLKIKLNGGQPKADILNFVNLSYPFINPYFVYYEDQSELDYYKKTKKTLTQEIEAVDSKVIIKRDILPPLKDFEPNNAVDYVSRSTTVANHLVTSDAILSNVYSEYAFNNYSIPNVVKVTSTSPPVDFNFPKSAFYVSPQKLIDIGIVPDDINPPIVNIKGGYIKETRVNCSVNALYFILRYGGDVQVEFNPSTDVLYLNNNSSVFWLASGDEDYWNGVGESWSHTVETSETDDHVIYAHKGVPIPATYNGNALTGVFITYRAGSSGLCEFEMFSPSVTLESVDFNITEPYLTPRQKQIEVVSEEMLSGELSEKINNSNNSIIRTLTIKNCDKLLLNGASFAAGGARDFKDKGWVCMVSQLSDWNCEGYGKSGDGYIDVYNAINSNTKRFHSEIGILDYNKTYFLISIAENDSPYWGLSPSKYWRDSVLRTVKAVKATGALPILHTNFGNQSNNMVYSILRDVAEKEGCFFWDISSVGYLFNQNRYLPFWNNGHPGVRTNTLLWYPTLNFVNKLPQPKNGIKIFRNRSDFNYSTSDDLLFSSTQERMRKWREISIGHNFSTDATMKYYDELDSGNIVTQNGTSEYLKLINNENVNFQDKALLQITLPSTCSQTSFFKLILNNKNLDGYIRKYVDPSEVIDNSDSNAGFRLSIEGVGSAEIGAVYTSDDPDYNGINFTVVESTDYAITCSPSSTITTEGLESGTLTKISGTGDTSINYEAVFLTLSTDFLSTAFTSIGHWESLSKNEDDDFELSDLKSYMDYDKIYILLDNSSDFNINDIEVKYINTGEKNDRPITLQGDQSLELLNENNFDDSGILSWNNPDTKTPFIPADTNTPVGTPTKIIELSTGESLDQNFTVNVGEGEGKTLKITIYARRFPSIFDSNGTFSLNDNTGDNEIYEDSYDFSEVNFKISRSLGAIDFLHEFKELVPLHWSKIEREVFINAPKDDIEYNFSIECSDKSIQLAYASIKI